MISNEKEMQVSIELININKKYEYTKVLKDINLKVYKGELITLLGPSGCGKTTTLNCITGIVSPDSGKIIIDGKDVTEIQTYKRDCGQVFQSFALFPHLSVYDNIAFPLVVRKIPKEKIRKKVTELLRMVHLEDQMNKRPNQLSGGQQQRVGLCRALVYRPKVLLFDEPLSNLDAKLREAMRFEIREIQSHYKITSIFVTHDQREALAISDRIAVMENGKIVQYDTPYEIYREPKTEFVAGFIGLSNLLRGQVESYSKENTIIRVGDIRLNIKSTKEIQPGTEILCLIRPKDIKFILTDEEKTKKRNNIFKVKIERRTFLGEIIDYRTILPGYGPIRIVAESDIPYDNNHEAIIYIPPHRCWILRN